MLKEQGKWTRRGDQRGGWVGGGSRGCEKKYGKTGEFILQVGGAGNLNEWGRSRRIRKRATIPASQKRKMDRGDVDRFGARAS